MADALFYSQIHAMMNGAGVDLDTDTVKADLIDHAVTTPSVSTHDFWDDLSGAAYGTPVTVTVAAPASGQIDATDFTWSSVPGSTSYESVVFFEDNGGATSTWPLIYYCDAATGLPVTSNGANINFLFGSYWFSLKP